MLQKQYNIRIKLQALLGTVAINALLTSLFRLQRIYSQDSVDRITFYVKHDTILESAWFVQQNSKN